MMGYEDYFDNPLKSRRFLENPFDKISISKMQYEKIKEKAEKFEILVEEYKKIKGKNQKLHEEMKDLKEDARKYKEFKELSEKYLNSLLRVQADFENFRKMKERENYEYKLRAKESLLRKLIKHYDDLKRASVTFKNLENGGNVKKGFEMIVKNFEGLFAEEGIKPMECEGELFDPYKHEVLMVEEGCDDLPENTILEELEKGYYLHDKVLRPARVKISKKLKLKL